MRLLSRSNRILTVAAVLSTACFFPPAAQAASGDPMSWTTTLVHADRTQPVGNAMWVGDQAWNDRYAVRREITSRVARGEVPYIYFYHWGHRMWEWSSVSNWEIDTDWANWATEVAQGIGQGRAFVVVEPEWDIDNASGNDARFKAGMKRVIAIFRQHAPNAKLINGPGMWKGDDYYQQWRDVSALFDYQGFNHFVISSNPDCTWLSYGGTSWVENMNYAEALNIVSTVQQKAARVKRIFGGSEVFLTDLGVTRCDWGEQGQAEVVRRLVDVLPSLYDQTGLRGMAMRHGAPAPAGRDMGYNNEGEFAYHGYAAELEVQRGVQVIQQHLRSLGSGGATQPSTGTTQPTTGTTQPATGSTVPSTGVSYDPGFRLGSGNNEWWVEVYADAEGVEVELEGGWREQMQRSSWGSFTLGALVPSGARIRFIARKGQAVGQTAFFRYLQETPVLASASTSQPSTGTTAPSTGTTAPSTGTTAPSTGTTAPSTGTTAPSTGTTAPSTGTTAPSTGTPQPPAYDPGFVLGNGANEWWVEFRADADSVRVVISGTSYTMTRTAWGAFTLGRNVPRGTSIRLAATKGGLTAETGTFGYLVDQPRLAVSSTTPATGTTTPATGTTPPATGTTTPSTGTTPAAAAYDPGFTQGNGANERWMEYRADADAVRVVISGTSYTMTKTAWGAFTLGRNVPRGTSIRLVATKGGLTAETSTFQYLVQQPVLAGSSTGTGSATTGTTSPTSTWSPEFRLGSINEWWIDVTVQDAARVTASVNGGAAVNLPKTAWGSFAAPVRAPTGAQVVITATSASGAQASRTYSWLR